MTKFLPFVVAAIVLDCLGLTAYSFLEHNGWKLVTIGIFVVATLFMLVLAARQMRLGELFLLGLIVSVVALLSLQMLGYTAFPGLVKDVQPLSPNHYRLMTLQFVLACAFYFTGIVLARVLFGRRNVDAGNRRS